MWWPTSSGGDIGATATAYSEGWLGRSTVGGQQPARL